MNNNNKDSCCRHSFVQLLQQNVRACGQQFAKQNHQSHKNNNHMNGDHIFLKWCMRKVIIYTSKTFCNVALIVSVRVRCFISEKRTETIQTIQGVRKIWMLFSQEEYRILLISAGPRMATIIKMQLRKHIHNSDFNTGEKYNKS